MTQIVDSPKRPKVDLVGTYRLEEPTRKLNPRDGIAYEVPRGEYPVMGLLSADGTKIENVGIIFSAANRTTGEMVSVVEKVRPLDVPALVQRQQISLAHEDTGSRRVLYPLSMFLGEAPDKKQSQSQSRGKAKAQEQAPDQGQRRGMNVGV
jgi:hypothetical protein